MGYQVPVKQDAEAKHGLWRKIPRVPSLALPCQTHKYSGIPYICGHVDLGGDWGLAVFAIGQAAGERVA